MRDGAVWLLRALWFVLPVTAGPVISAVLDETADRTRLAFLIGAWVLWGIGLVATAVLLPVSLTAIRLLAPAVVAAALWAGLREDDVGAGEVAAVVIAALAAVVAYSSLVGDRMVDGASYGDERRMLLRVPTRQLPVTVVAGAIAIAGALVGPMLLVVGRWVLGGLLTVVGLPFAALAVAALHQLSRRWIVFVPTGFVLHDLQVLTEPVLFRRTAVERLGPAIEGTPARDLSNGAAGLVIECELTDPAPLGLRIQGPGDRRHAAEAADVRRFLFVPSLPGALLDEAERRRIPVG